MKNFACLTIVLAACSLAQAQEAPPASREITVSGTRFLLDGKPFDYTGVSFFNAIYNPTFNASSPDRCAWIRKFTDSGINVFRVWCQWDSTRGFADAGPKSTMYNPDGSLRPESLARLKDILADCDQHGVVIELVLFSRESWNEKIRLSPESSDQAVEAIARELRPHRNLTFQVWNEHDHRTIELFKIIKKTDPKRLVTNSPGYAGVLGTDEENQLLDYLTPHTSRQGSGKTWEIAPREIAGLIAKFNKPVVDDEPARNGTPKFGGPKNATHPTDHILHIWEVWKAGGHATYHHDMFQNGYGANSVPKSGIPDPSFSPYHKQVFDFLAQREKYHPTSKSNAP